MKPADDVLFISQGGDRAAVRHGSVRLHVVISRDERHEATRRKGQNPGSLPSLGRTGSSPVALFGLNQLNNAATSREMETDVG